MRIVPAIVFVLFAACSPVDPEAAACVRACDLMFSECWSEKSTVPAAERHAECLDQCDLALEAAPEDAAGWAECVLDEEEDVAEAGASEDACAPVFYCGLSACPNGHPASWTDGAPWTCADSTSARPPSG